MIHAHLVPIHSWNPVILKSLSQQYNLIYHTLEQRHTYDFFVGVDQKDILSEMRVLFFFCPPDISCGWPRTAAFKVKKHEWVGWILTRNWVEQRECACRQAIVTWASAVFRSVVKNLISTDAWEPRRAQLN